MGETNENKKFNENEININSGRYRGFFALGSFEAWEKWRLAHAPCRTKEMRHVRKGEGRRQYFDDVRLTFLAVVANNVANSHI